MTVVGVVTVVGVGADGWPGLGGRARTALTDAEVLLGATGQLDLLPAEVTGRRVPWPSPMMPAVPRLLAEHAHARVVVLASGDPLFFGVGRAVVDLLGPDRVEIVPHLSCLTLACARLGWPVEHTEVVSAVGRDLATLRAALHPGARLLVLLAHPHTPADVAGLVTELGYGPSPLTALTDLAAPQETRRDVIAREGFGPTSHPQRTAPVGRAPLTVVAIDAVAEPGAVTYGRVPGLPDDAFEHDGQITKREIRALTLAALAPRPGELLWDVGGGSGSIAIEWSRTHPRCRAIAVEPRADRRERMARNAIALGVPGLEVVDGAAPQALADLPTPDAVFVGGGVSRPGVLEACVAALPPGGRLVANGVVLETEVVLAQWYSRLGGTLVRVAVQRADAVGGFTGWRPAMPVTQWTWTRPWTETPATADTRATHQGQSQDQGHRQGVTAPHDRPAGPPETPRAEDPT